MRHFGLQVVTWIFARCVPKREREALLGDLAEEYALRMQEMSSSAALGWYLRQICVSAPALLWRRLTRMAWIPTAGVALLAYAAVGVMESTVNWTVYGSPATSADACRPLGMSLTFPAVVLIGYVAARFRRSATLALAAMMLLAVTLMTLLAHENLPLWYRLAYFLVGPAAALIGAALCSLRAARR
jgi:hypothetical protein